MASTGSGGTHVPGTPVPVGGRAAHAGSGAVDQGAEHAQHGSSCSAGTACIERQTSASCVAQACNRVQLPWPAICATCAATALLLASTMAASYFLVRAAGFSKARSLFTSWQVSGRPAHLALGLAAALHPSAAMALPAALLTVLWPVMTLASALWARAVSKRKVGASEAVPLDVWSASQWRALWQQMCTFQRQSLKIRGRKRHADGANGGVRSLTGIPTITTTPPQWRHPVHVLQPRRPTRRRSHHNTRPRNHPRSRFPAQNTRRSRACPRTTAPLPSPGTVPSSPPPWQHRLRPSRAPLARQTPPPQTRPRLLARGRLRGAPLQAPGP